MKNSLLEGWTLNALLIGDIHVFKKTLKSWKVLGCNLTKVSLDFVSVTGAITEDLCNTLNVWFKDFFDEKVKLPPNEFI